MICDYVYTQKRNAIYMHFDAHELKHSHKTLKHSHHSIIHKIKVLSQVSDAVDYLAVLLNSDATVRVVVAGKDSEIR